MDTRNELKTIPISQITIKDRTRKDFGSKEEWEEFKKDIAENGLISAIAVRRVSQDQYELLAGERRLRACTELGYSEINATIYTGEIDELDMVIIELAENLKRKNMTVEEEVAGKRRFLQLMQQKYGEKKKAGGDGVSLRDAAKMLGESPANLSRDVTLAEAFEVMPELKKAKTKKEALKLAKSNIRQLEEFKAVKKIEEERAEREDMTPQDFVAEWYKVGDFFDHIKDVSSDIVDLIEIDPPYAVRLDEVKKGGVLTDKGTEDYNEISDTKYPDFMKNVLREAYRVAAPNSWLVLWFGPEPWFEKMYQWALDAGWEGKRIPAIWYKMIPGQTNRPEIYLANSYETFFYFRKGTPAMNRKGRSNVFQCPPIPATKKSHPTERPIKLMEDVISTFVQKGSLILSPFAGSGNTLLAAANLDCKAFGYDLTKAYRDRYLTKVYASQAGSYKDGI